MKYNCPDCKTKLDYIILDYDDAGVKVGGYRCPKCKLELEAEEVEED